MPKVETIASSWQLLRFSLVSFFYKIEVRYGTECETHQVPGETGFMSHQVLIKAYQDIERNTHLEGPGYYFTRP